MYNARYDDLEIILINCYIEEKEINIPVNVNMNAKVGVLDSLLEMNTEYYHNGRKLDKRRIFRDYALKYDDVLLVRKNYTGK